MQPAFQSSQAFLGETSTQQADRAHTRLAGGLRVVARVSDHQNLVGGHVAQTFHENLESVRVGSLFSASSEEVSAWIQI
jgi:hypothetical protein